MLEPTPPTPPVAAPVLEPTPPTPPAAAPVLEPTPPTPPTTGLTAAALPKAASQDVGGEYIEVNAADAVELTRAEPQEMSVSEGHAHAGHHGHAWRKERDRSHKRRAPGQHTKAAGPRGDVLFDGSVVAPELVAAGTTRPGPGPDPALAASPELVSPAAEPAPVPELVLGTMEAIDDVVGELPGGSADGVRASSTPLPGAATSATFLEHF